HRILDASLAVMQVENYFSDFGSDLFVGDLESSSETSSCALAGIPTFPPRMISLAVSFLPYNFSLALPSDRRVEPSSETPANSPLLREYDKISAFITTSVAPSAVRPLGPAAAEASAPSFTLLVSSERAPFGFITSSTKSVACPPNWKPMLIPSSAYRAGGPPGPVWCGHLRQFFPRRR